MKRASINVDAALLRRVRREIGGRSDSAAVHAALTELLRLRQVQHLSEFYGSKAWSGDLGEMREDGPARQPAKRTPGRLGP